MKKIVLCSLLGFVSLSSSSWAGDICTQTSIDNKAHLTPKIRLAKSDPKTGWGFVQTWCLNGKPLVQDERFYFQGGGDGKFKSVSIYIGGNSEYFPDTANPGHETTSLCSVRAYLVDTSYTPTKIIRFGVRNACAEFDYISSGKKNMVVALKKNVKFKYQDGKLIPPKADEDLWAGALSDWVYANATPDKIVPFVEEIQTPK
jgi:hypothetical protein